MRDVPVRMRAAARYFGPPAAALVIFVALTALHTWPLARQGSAAIVTGADPMASMWSLNGLTQQLVRDPGHLLQGNVFYPFSNTLAILDHQTANAIVAAPMALAGASGTLIFNLAMLAAFVLNGFFTFLLVRRITGSFAGGLVAGCGFAFSSYHGYHIGQLHILATQWIPLALLLLLRFLDRPSRSRWAGFTAATAMVALSSWHVAVLGALTIGLVAVWSLLSAPQGGRRKLVGLAVTAVICGLMVLPLGRVYAEVGRQWPPRTGDGRETLGTLLSNSANVAGLVALPPNSEAPYAPLVGGSEYSEPGVFPGIVLLVLAVPALMPWYRRSQRPTGVARIVRWALLGALALVAVTLGAAMFAPRADGLLAWLRPVAPFALLGLAALASMAIAARRTPGDDPSAPAVLTFTALAVSGALLSLGPRVFLGDVDLGGGLWRMDLLPMRLIIRAPARLSLLLMLGTAVLAGIGTARLLRGLTPRRAALATTVLLALLTADRAFDMPSFHDAPPAGEVDLWLAELPDEGAVIEYPLRDHHWAIYASQRYDRRIVNGQGYLYPWEYRELERFEDLGGEQLAILWEHFHPRFVVVRTELYPRPQLRALMARIAERSDALRLRRQLGADYVYELVDRGRDSELYRRWPRKALADRSTVELTATVNGARPGTVNLLALALNDEMLLEARQTEPGGVESYTVPFTEEPLRADMNVFALWGDYRFTDSEQARLIGETGVRLAADVAIRSERQRARVQINGRVIRPDKGYFLAQLDAASGAVLRAGQFNVSWFADDSDALADFVRQVPDGTPVLVVTEFDASRQLRQSAVDALASLGLATDLRGRFQVQHAAIGVKGAPPGSALEVTDPREANIVVGEPALREVHVHSFELQR